MSMCMCACVCVRKDRFFLRKVKRPRPLAEPRDRVASSEPAQNKITQISLLHIPTSLLPSSTSSSDRPRSCAHSCTHSCTHTSANKTDRTPTLLPLHFHIHSQRSFMNRDHSPQADVPKRSPEPGPPPSTPTRRANSQRRSTTSGTPSRTATPSTPSKVQKRPSSHHVLAHVFESITLLS